MTRHRMPRCPSALSEPRRNHYYFGKQLDVYHFQLETHYFNAKRWLLNRLTLGFGVVCGLNVEHCRGKALSIEAGLAIDGWGREIIVPEDCVKEFDQLGKEHQNPTTYYLVAIYQESCTEPAPVHTSHCAEPIHHNEICESCDFKLLSRKPEWYEPDSPCDVVDKCEWEQDKLVRYIAKNCPPCDDRPTPVFLAEIKVNPPDHERTIDVHIERRPIVFRNALLGDLLKCLTKRIHDLNHP